MYFVNLNLVLRELVERGAGKSVDHVEGLQIVILTDQRSPVSLEKEIVNKYSKCSTTEIVLHVCPFMYKI